jgi:predicted nucleic acid-binding protein
MNELLNKNDAIVITVITAYELLKGAQLSTRRQDNLQATRKAISSAKILDLTPEACAEAARIYCELKNAGKLIGEFDILNAAIAKTNNEPILTYDQHFNAITGLRPISP